MTVYLVISLPNVPCMHHKYMVLANPIHKGSAVQDTSVPLICERQKHLQAGITNVHMCTDEKPRARPHLTGKPSGQDACAARSSHTLQVAKVIQSADPPT